MAPPTRTGERSGSYDTLAGLVFLVGIYNGVAPFISRFILGDDLLLALTLRLPAPWWWLASLFVLATTVVLLALIDQAKQRHLASQATSND